MPITHNGRSIPRDPAPFAPGHPEWVDIEFDDAVDAIGAILSAEWTVPDGWSVGATEGPVPLTVDGVTYTDGLRAFVTPPAKPGVYKITCTATFADDTELQRSRYVTVADL